MDYFCDNQLCALHVKERRKTLEVEDGGRRRQVNRHLYIAVAGYRSFFLCDTCHAAVQMVVGGGTSMVDRDGERRI
jgi:hypothetical protein